MATNALRHGAGPITVRLSCTPDGDLWLKVHDHGPVRPVAQETTADDEQGRGLSLLAFLTDLNDGTWGVADDISAASKTVYATVALNT